MNLTPKQYQRLLETNVYRAKAAGFLRDAHYLYSVAMSNDTLPRDQHLANILRDAMQREFDDAMVRADHSLEIINAEYIRLGVAPIAHL